MDFINDIINFPFLQRAIFATLLSGIACGIIGTYIVVRRMVFLSGGITHSSFGGIGIAYFLGIEPILGAIVFAVLSAFGIEYIGRSKQIREDSAIGILWSLGMAIGIIFVFLTPGYAPNLMSFLFGNILLVDEVSLIILIIFDIALIILFSLFYKIIIYTALDREFAQTQGVPVKFISLAMMILVAIAIVLNIKIVGIVLLISLLTIPVVIASLLTNSYFKITIFSCIIAILSTFIGLGFSYYFNIPAGAISVVLLSLLFGITKVAKLLTQSTH